MLTLKQQRFIDAYLTECNGNATASARFAGYATPMQEGYRLLRNAEIQAEIARLYREFCMPAEEVLARLSDLARGVGGFFTVTEVGRVRVDMDALKAAGKLHLVKSFKDTRFGQEVEFYDALAALTQIGRHHKLFTDKAEATGRDGTPIQISIDDRRQAESELDAWRKKQTERLAKMVDGPPA